MHKRLLLLTVHGIRSEEQKLLTSAIAREAVHTRYFCTSCVSFGCFSQCLRNRSKSWSTLAQILLNDRDPGAVPPTLMNGLRNQQRTDHRQSLFDDFGSPFSTDPPQQGGWNSTAHYFRPIYDDTHDFSSRQFDNQRNNSFPVSGRQSVPVPGPNRSSYFEDAYRSRPIYNPAKQRDQSEVVPRSVPSAPSALNGFPRFHDDTQLSANFPPSNTSSGRPPAKQDFCKHF